MQSPRDVIVSAVNLITSHTQLIVLETEGKKSCQKYHCPTTAERQERHVSVAIFSPSGLILLCILLTPHSYGLPRYDQLPIPLMCCLPEGIELLLTEHLSRLAHF